MLNGRPHGLVFVALLARQKSTDVQQKSHSVNRVLVPVIPHSIDFTPEIFHQTLPKIYPDKSELSPSSGLLLFVVGVNFCWNELMERFHRSNVRDICNLD